MKIVSVLVVFCLVASAAARRDLFQTSVSSSASASSSSGSGVVSSRATARSGPSSSSRSSSAESAKTAGTIDVYCLVDNTEKKQNSNFVGELAANAKQLVDSLFGGASSPRFGLGIYSDNAEGGFSFTNLLNITSNQESAISAISKLSAKNTSFAQESQFFALEAVATRTTIGFRGSATKIVVWIGNRGGKDPVGKSTEVSATAALTGSKFRVVAIDTGRLNAVGQASRIAAATNGIFYKVNGDGRFRTVALSQTGNGGSSSASASATGDVTVVSTTVDGQTTTVKDPVNLIDAILDGVFALGS